MRKFANESDGLRMGRFLSRFGRGGLPGTLARTAKNAKDRTPPNKHCRGFRAIYT